MVRSIRSCFLPFAVALSAALLSCGRPPHPEKPIDRLFREMSERREEFPVEAVRGRRIVIDPGHGGRFAGTAGAGGLLEKDVNLGVALYLWGLLRDAGADAHLTRSVDRDLLEGDEDALADDLARRVALADSLGADLFVSIHHNARADTNRSVNRIEVYYPMGDPGASRDAARAIHRHLMRNLGIDGGKVLPGNFYVLRENGAPAVLGESAYLSHPPVEKKLALGEKRRLEAEAYFLGIVTYFARGVPRCAVELPPPRIEEAAGLFFSSQIADEEGGEGIDPATVAVRLDGRPLLVGYDPAAGLAEAPLPADLPPGPHRIAVAARNLRGNAAPARECRFEVALPPVRAAVEAVRPPGPAEELLVAARLFDERDLPVAEGLAVRVAGIDRPLRVRSGAVSFRLEGKALPDTIILAGDRFSLAAPRPGTPPPSPPGLLLAEDEEGPAAGASVWRNGEWRGRTGPGGWLALEEPPGEEDYFRIDSNGRRPSIVEIDEGIVRARIAPAADSPLRGTAISVDPAGAVEPGLFPPADQSLVAALALEEMIRWAGGVPHLTRAGVDVPDDSERLQLSRRYPLDYWVTFETGDSLAVRHFPGSREGAPAARAVAGALAAAFAAEVAVTTGAEAVLRDTPCPALVITLPRAESDGRLARARMRAAAQAVCEALCARVAGEAGPAEPPLVIAPVEPGAIVRIDDAVTFQPTGDTLIVRYPPAGNHRVAVEQGGSWREMLVR